jgi:transposase-like protein
MAEERIDGIEGVRKLVESAQPDVLRELLHTIVTQLMSAEADVLCGAGYGERSAERVNSRNGYLLPLTLAEGFADRLDDGHR